MSTVATTNLKNPDSASNNVTLDSAGRVLLGTSTARNLTASGVSSSFLVEGTTDETRRIAIISSANSSAGGILVCGHQRSGTVGGTTQLNVEDNLGGVNCLAYNSGDGLWYTGAAVFAYAAANHTSGNIPTRLAFFTNGAGSLVASEAMRINSDQELLIGYTTDNGAYKLQVNSQIFATSSTIATSDGRYKENVATLGGCLDLVKALRPVSFIWKPQQPITRLDEDGNEVVVREAHNFPAGTQVGFIAQEVQEVLADKPWLGGVIKENRRAAVHDAEGNELAPEEQFYGIAEGNLIAVLTSALQEAIGRIETLEAKVAALEDN
jgi:hypothetical protein